MGEREPRGQEEREEARIGRFGDDSTPASMQMVRSAVDGHVLAAPLTDSRPAIPPRPPPLPSPPLLPLMEYVDAYLPHH